MKGGVAAMIDAARVDRRARRPRRAAASSSPASPTRSTRASAPTRSCATGGPTRPSSPSRPTSRIGVAHKGFAWRRGRDARRGRARQPAGRRARRDLPHGPRARRRSRQLDRDLQRGPAAPSPRPGLAARVDDRRRARVEHATPIAACCRYERRTLPGEPPTAPLRRSRRRPRRASAARDPEFAGDARVRVRARAVRDRRARRDLPQALLGQLRAAAGRTAEFVGRVVLDRRADPRRRRAFPTRRLRARRRRACTRTEEYVTRRRGDRLPRRAGRTSARRFLRVKPRSRRPHRRAGGLLARSPQDPLQHEPDVGGALAEAAHEVREPLAAERHVDAHAVAVGARSAVCRSRRMPYSIWNSKRSFAMPCSAANALRVRRSSPVVRGDGRVVALAAAASSSCARRRRRPRPWPGSATSRGSLYAPFTSRTRAPSAFTRARSVSLRCSADCSTMPHVAVAQVPHRLEDVERDVDVRRVLHVDAHEEVVLLRGVEDAAQVVDRVRPVEVEAELRQLERDVALDAGLRRSPR